MRSVILLGLASAMLLFLPTASWAQAACVSTPQPNCAVYKGCFEANCSCASTDSPYVATFGPKYCERFRDAPGFSANGKAWRDKTLKCLVDRASAAFAAQPKGQCNCRAVQNAMVASHTDCYTSAPSFCVLSDADIRTVARIVELRDLLGMRNGSLEAGKTFATCVLQGGPALHLLRVFAVEAAQQSFPNQATRVKELLTQTAAYARDLAAKTPEPARTKLRAFAEGAEALRDELFPIPLG